MKLKFTRLGKLTARQIALEREVREKEVYIQHLEYMREEDAAKIRRLEATKSLREIWRDPTITSEEAKRRAAEIVDQYEEEEGIPFASP